MSGRMGFPMAAMRVQTWLETDPLVHDAGLHVGMPELHEVRLPEKPLDGFEEGRGVNLTLYTLCGDPEETIAEMTRVREELETAGRMTGAGHRVVRAGDAMTWTWGVADPVLRADPRDIPHIQHNQR